MRRWHEETNLMRRRIRFIETQWWYRPEKQHLGMYRKRHPADCGHSRCYMCHWEKMIPKPRGPIRSFAIEDSLDA